MSFRGFVRFYLVPQTLVGLLFGFSFGLLTSASIHEWGLRHYCFLMDGGTWVPSGRGEDSGHYSLRWLCPKEYVNP